MQCAARACQLCAPETSARRSSSFRPGHRVSTSGAREASVVGVAGKQRHRPRRGRRDDAAVNAGDGPVAKVSTDVTEEDKAHMRRALELAARATGKTFPNPVVGCVIVDPSTGETVGQGFHPKAGEPHAEVFALRAAGHLARGATAYVSLEPCDHFGRTPPCSRALVDAGVARVVVGFVDPDPRVSDSGGGIRTLLDAGVDVAVGCEEEACREINADFIARNT